MITQLTICGGGNVSTTLGGSCENVGRLSCGNIFQESFKNVDIFRWQDGVLLWKCVLWYIQCFMTDSGRRDHRDHISPLGNFVYA